MITVTAMHVRKSLQLWELLEMWEICCNLKCLQELLEMSWNLTHVQQFLKMNKVILVGQVHFITR